MIQGFFFLNNKNDLGDVEGKFGEKFVGGVGGCRGVGEPRLGCRGVSGSEERRRAKYLE